MKKIILMLTIAIGAMGTAFAQQENPRGLYKLQKFVYDDGSENTPPFNQYKYCADNITMQISLQETENTAAFLMGNNDGKPLNYTGKQPVGDDGRGTQIFDSNKEHFTLRWYNNRMPNNQLFPYDAFTSEVYSSKTGISAKMKDILRMLSGTITAKKPNKFTGVWKRRGMSDKVNGTGQLFEMRPMYKIYTDNRMLIMEGEFNDAANIQIAGNLWPYEAFTDRLIKENMNSCLVTWIDDNSFSLIWITEGYPAVEIWDKVDMPEIFKNTFK